MADSQKNPTVETATEVRPSALARILEACEKSLQDGNVSHAELLASIQSARRVLGSQPASNDRRPAGRAAAQVVQRELQPDVGEIDQQGPLIEVDVSLLGEFLTEIAGLCHKINNPLTAVMGRTQMMQMKLRKQGGDESTVKSVVVIEESAKRVAGLVRELASVVSNGRKEFVEHWVYDSNAG